jgi:hypothetical protein
MDDNTVDRKFESIVLNEKIRVIDRELSYASGSAGLDFSALNVFEKFLKPSSTRLPDIDTDYEDPWRNFTAGRTDI